MGLCVFFLMQISSSAVFLNACVLVLERYKEGRVPFCGCHAFALFSNKPSVCAVHSLWKGVKAVGLLGIRESHSHARGEWGVEDDCSTLVARRQVDGGHSANALTIHNHVLWADAVSIRETNNNKTLCFGS